MKKRAAAEHEEAHAELHEKQRRADTTWAHTDAGVAAIALLGLVLTIVGLSSGARGSDGGGRVPVVAGRAAVAQRRGWAALARRPAALPTFSSMPTRRQPWI